ncbi:RNAse P Rpr2/Rpp21/SNM1 subunit domain-containing protein [Gigaspora rosea]|uniref:RNAse P Rpr2/Rpp21/SNM1 subunit domain-containing protein n=1 Tax=Gigaspora rosea TaxID=44941 RepID=A0A397VQ44_9GLOM|nr:RNAse P Rpr2/Rpp21/SNM1 subunit domain-containing protein [Gigaspora rosea]
MGKKTEPGQVLHRELYQRMNFLYQAATLMTTITTSAPTNTSTNTKKSLIPLSRFYISTMKSIGTKQVLRIDPSIKRTLCKRCDSVLLPGVTSQIRIKSKPEPQLQMMCTQCGTARGYPIRKGYQLFSEKSENIYGTKNDQNQSKNK